MVPQNLPGSQIMLQSRQRVLWLGFILCTGWACAQQSGQLLTPPPFAPAPLGSGARALGQSAFIAVADDATAGSWNPAGLINLEKPEASFVGLWSDRRDEYSSTMPGTSLDGDSRSEWEINFMSYAHPIKVAKSDVALSVNYHQVYDLGLQWNLYTQNYSGETVSTGAISAYSLAGGVSLPFNPKIAVGGSFNWYVQSLHNSYVRRSKTTRWTNLGFFTVRTDTDETLDDLDGYNFTFGLLWDAYERKEKLLTLGLVCDTPFTAKVDQEIVDTRANGTRVPRDPARVDIDFPLSLGAGVNYRFCDEYSAAFDLRWTDWSQFGYTAAATTPGVDALTFRLGFERLWFSEPARDSVLALRGGAFYEPRPGWDDIWVVYGLSTGLGWTLRERLSLDLAYQFRWGQEAVKLGSAEFDYGIEEHWLISSVIMYL